MEGGSVTVLGMCDGIECLYLLHGCGFVSAFSFV